MSTTASPAARSGLQYRIGPENVSASISRSALSALGAAAGDRQMAEVGDESEPSTNRLDDGGGLVRVELPRPATRSALKMTVLRLGQHVELLATRRRVTVAQVSQLLEHVERPVDGRGRGVRI